MARRRGTAQMGNNSRYDPVTCPGVQRGAVVGGGGPRSLAHRADVEGDPRRLSGRIRTASHANQTGQKFFTVTFRSVVPAGPTRRR